MTEEELKQKCTERAKIFQQAMESCKSSSPIDCIEWFADMIADLEALIEKMKCCYNCSKWNDGQCADVPNDSSYYSADFVCEDWEMKENE